MVDLIFSLSGFLQIYLMIKLPIWLGVVEKPRIVPRDYEGAKFERRSDYSRGKYYMHEIPKGISDDELIMNDVIDFEQAFK